MALVNCVECGKEISDKARWCPQCGYPYEEQRKGEGAHEKELERTVFSEMWRKRYTIVGMLALVMLLLIAVSFCSVVLTTGHH